MFRVSFVTSTGELNEFAGVKSIEFGSSIDKLEKIEDDKILQYAFPTTAFYHLTGPATNVTYDADNIAYVEIHKS